MFIPLFNYTYISPLGLIEAQKTYRPVDMCGKDTLH